MKGNKIYFKNSKNNNYKKFLKIINVVFDFNYNNFTDFLFILGDGMIKDPEFR